MTSMKNIQSILYLIPKSSYYNSEQEVIREGLALHDEIFRKDRELYTYLLYFTNSTYYSKSLIVEKLLGNSIFKDENKDLLDKDPFIPLIEEALILHALYNENITHALKLLLQLKNSRINNARTQKIILRFIFDRKNTDYIAIKYKNKIKQLLVHALGLKTVHDILENRPEGQKKFEKLIRIYNNPYDLEVFYFVFDKNYDYTSEYLQEYVKIREDFKNNTVDLTKPTKLPKEVLEGFNNFYQRGINITTLISMGNVSDKQKIQLQNTVIRHSNNMMELKIDLRDYSIMEIYKYLYSKLDITQEEIEEGLKIVEEKAREIRESIKSEFFVDLDNTAVIVDCSDSHSGSKQTKLHPFFKNMILMHVFSNDKKDNIFFVGGRKESNGLMYPAGDSDLSTPLLQAVKKGYKNIIVLSDGFENVGNFDKVYQQLKNIGADIKVVHFNPVFSPRDFSFKSISDNIITLPFTSEDDIRNMALFYLLNKDTDSFKRIIRKHICGTILPMKIQMPSRKVPKNA